MHAAKYLINILNILTPTEDSYKKSYVICMLFYQVLTIFIPPIIVYIPASPLKTSLNYESNIYIIKRNVVG